MSENIGNLEISVTANLEKLQQDLRNIEKQLESHGKEGTRKFNNETRRMATSLSTEEARRKIEGLSLEAQALRREINAKQRVNIDQKSINDVRSSLRNVSYSIGEVGKNFKTANVDAGIFSGTLVKLTASFYLLQQAWGFFKEGIDIFVSNQQEISKLENFLKNAGDTGGWTVTKIQELNSELEKMTIYDDEAILSGITNNLARMGLVNQNLKETQILILDVASALKMDLTQATELVGAALQNPEKALRLLTSNTRLFNAETTAAIEQMLKMGDTAGATAEMLRVMKEQYTGSAKIELDSSPLAGIEKIIDDIKMALGGVAISIFNPEVIASLLFVLGTVEKILRSMAGWPTIIAMAAGGIKLLGTGINGIANVIFRIKDSAGSGFFDFLKINTNAFKEQAETIKKEMESIVEKINTLTNGEFDSAFLEPKDIQSNLNVMRELSLSDISAEEGKILDGLISGVDEYSEKLKELKTVQRASWQAGIAGAANMAFGILGVISIVWGIIDALGIFKSEVDEVKTATDELNQKLADSDAVFQVEMDIIKNLQNEYNEIVDSIDATTMSTEDLQSAIDSANGKVGEMNSKISELNDKYGMNIASIPTLIYSEQALADALAATSDSTETATDSLNSNTDAQNVFNNGASIFVGNLDSISNGFWNQKIAVDSTTQSLYSYMAALQLKARADIRQGELETATAEQLSLEDRKKAEANKYGVTDPAQYNDPNAEFKYRYESSVRGGRMSRVKRQEWVEIDEEERKINEKMKAAQDNFLTEVQAQNEAKIKYTEADKKYWEDRVTEYAQKIENLKTDDPKFNENMQTYSEEIGKAKDKLKQWDIPDKKTSETKTTGGGGDRTPKEVVENIFTEENLKLQILLETDEFKKSMLELQKSFDEQKKKWEEDVKKGALTQEEYNTLIVGLQIDFENKKQNIIQESQQKINESILKANELRAQLEEESVSGTLIKIEEELRAENQRYDELQLKLRDYYAEKKILTTEDMALESKLEQQHQNNIKKIKQRAINESMAYEKERIAKKRELQLRERDADEEALKTLFEDLSIKNKYMAETIMGIYEETNQFATESLSSLLKFSGSWKEDMNNVWQGLADGLRQRIAQMVIDFIWLKGIMALINAMFGGVGSVGAGAGAAIPVGGSVPIVSTGNINPKINIPDNTMNIQQSYRMDTLSKEIRDVNNSIQAMNMNLVKKELAVNVINKIDEKSLVRQIKPIENTLLRHNEKLK